MSSKGALIRVTAYASLNQVPITTELAQHLLADLLSDTDAEAAHRRGAARRDRRRSSASASRRCKGKSRQRPLVTARQIAMYVFRELTDLSYPAHRPAVRRPRPHHGHPRRREDPAPDERAQADLRPGHRPAPAAEVMIGAAGDRAADACGQRVDDRRATRWTTAALSTEPHASSFRALWTAGTSACARRDRSTLRRRRVVHNPQPLLLTTDLDTSPAMRRKAAL